MKKRIWLIRHGETELNATGKLQGRGNDVPLNQIGQDQAQKLSSNLVGIDVIISSTLNRALETAQILHSSNPNALLFTEADLQEISWGDLEGFPPDSSLDLLLSQWAQGDVDAAPPNGESPLTVERRAIPAILHYIQTRPEHNLAFVGSHI
jgi:probable phosphoglycerate mutase